MSFTKYEKRGAYHWRELENRFPTAYSARLHAQYGWFVREATARSPQLILDIGCGDAALTHLLTRTGARVVGIEPEDSGIEVARSALGRAGSSAEVMRGRGEDLPFEDGTVSLVVLSEVVEHIEHVDPILREAARVLSADGAVLISTPQWQKPELRPFHVHEFRSDELRDLLREYFTEVEVRVGEPPRLYDGYLGSAGARVAVNVLSLAGLNPFRLTRPATAQRRAWRELYATASRPRAAA